MYYFVSLIPVIEGGYSCRFADFPEACTQGETIEEALAMAEDVLRIWAEDYEPVGDKKRPTPSTLQEALERTKEDIKEDLDCVDQSKPIICQLVRFPNVSTKPVRINISFPANVLEQIDKKASRLGLTRSKLLANAALLYDA